MGLADDAERSAVALSGGQMQRVTMARRWCTGRGSYCSTYPSRISTISCVRLRHDLRRVIKKLGLTALYVTHEQEEVVVIGDRICVLRDGKLL